MAATHPRWALGFADELWWSGVAAPNWHSWAPAGGELRWLQKTLAKADPDPPARACDGLLVRPIPPPPEPVWLRFATGQPVSGLTTQWLAECSDHLAALGQQALLLVWDNASWHRSQEVQRWLRRHNQQVKQTRQGVRIRSCRWPTTSPWLNPIEPKWIPGKRAIVEPERV